MHLKQANFWRLAVSEHHDESGIAQQIMKSLPETSLRIVQSRGVNLAQNTMSHRDYLFLHQQYSISGKEPSSAMTLVDLFFGPLVFQFFGPDNLVRVSTVSLTWWRYVFQGCKSTAKMLLECEGIDLAEMGNLYQKVPLWFFALKKMINLKGTSISPKDFLKLAAVAKERRILNLASCMQITELSIFQVKPSLCSLRKINISHNKQLSVLSVACLCPYQSFQSAQEDLSWTKMNFCSW